MKVTYQQTKGRRIKRFGFLGVTVMRGDSMWWSYDLRKWVSFEELPRPSKKGASTHAPCRSVRAFKRMLRDNPSIRGRATLVSRWVGFHVYG
jgi:hypothetical protein